MQRDAQPQDSSGRREWKPQRGASTHGVVGVAVSERCDTELVGMGNDAAVVKTAGSLEDEDRFI